MRLSRLALSLVLASACHQQSAPNTNPAPAPLSGEFTVKVINHGRLDVVIYVVHSGSRERIGEATASATATFKFSMRHLGAGRSYSLFGDPIGSTTENAQSETLVAENGELVIWTLEDDLRRSSVEVREDYLPETVPDVPLP
jgi:hypothetical protein